MTHSEVRARWVQRREDYARTRALVSGEVIADEVLHDLDGLAEADAGASLTLTAASALCGYSRRHLARLVKNGTIPSVGNAPKVRPSDLPLKPSALRISPQGASLETARGRIAKSVINP